MSLRKRSYMVEDVILLERRSRGKKSGLDKLKERYGIVHTKKRQSHHSVHSLGYSEKKKAWCGWSHRAFHCFPVGHKVKEGHMPSKLVGQTVKNEKDSERFASEFSKEVS